MADLNITALPPRTQPQPQQQQQQQQNVSQPGLSDLYAASQLRKRFPAEQKVSISDDGTTSSKKGKRKPTAKQLEALRKAREKRSLKLAENYNEARNIPKTIDTNREDTSDPLTPAPAPKAVEVQEEKTNFPTMEIEKTVRSTLEKLVYMEKQFDQLKSMIATKNVQQESGQQNPPAPNIPQSSFQIAPKGSQKRHSKRKQRQMTDSENISQQDYLNAPLLQR